MTFLRLADELGLPRIVSVQNAYNLLNRTYEDGLAEVSIREQAGLLAYSPLAAATLTGKYLDGAVPPGTRRAIDHRKSRYDKVNADPAVRAYLDIAKRHGLDPAHLALAFVNQQPFVTSNIIGATSMEHLKTNIDSIDVKLSDEVLKEIEEVHEGSRIPVHRPLPETLKTPPVGLKHHDPPVRSPGTASSHPGTSGRLGGGVPGARWTEVQNLHLTSASSARSKIGLLPDIDEALAGVSAPAFDLVLDGVGQFGSGSRSRILWAGVERNERCSTLNQKVEFGLVRSAGPCRRRSGAIRPHVTLPGFTALPRSGSAASSRIAACSAPGRSDPLAAIAADHVDRNSASSPRMKRTISVQATRDSAPWMIRMFLNKLFQFHVKDSRHSRDSPWTELCRAFSAT